jgi:hypothetical protein
MLLDQLKIKALVVRAKDFDSTINLKNAFLFLSFCFRIKVHVGLFLRQVQLNLKFFWPQGEEFHSVSNNLWIALENMVFFLNILSKF